MLGAVTGPQTTTQHAADRADSHRPPTCPPSPRSQKITGKNLFTVKDYRAAGRWPNASQT
jgi:hypothetical protein